MGVAFLQINALLRINDVEHRVRRKINDESWQLEEVKTGRVLEFMQTDLLRKVETRELKFASNSLVLRLQATQLDIPPEELETAKLRRLYVLATINVPNTRSSMRAAIRDTWTKLAKPANPPSWTAVYHWKKRYLAAGEDFRVLLDNNHRKGNRTERYPAEIEQLCQQAISVTYLRRERTSIKATLEDAQMRVAKENLQRPTGMELPLPPRRYLKRLIDKIPAYDKCVAQKGREVARRQYRAVTGHRITERPLQRAEMDHTVLDIIVVDERNLMPLGRPYLTLCIDDHTRCVLGIYVGFTPPSYLSAAQCLKHAILPKTTLHDIYPDIKAEWLACGVVEELVIDNGPEFHSPSLEQLCFALGMELHYSPRKEPWFKGKVERFFGTLNGGLLHTMPGTTFGSIVERGDYDALHKASISLTELRHYLHLWIVDHYHQTIHRSLGITPDEMWRSTVRPEDIRMADETVNLDIIVGTTFRRRLTHKGIEFANLSYNSPELTDLRRRYGSELGVEIRVDESNLGAIHVFAPGLSTPCRVPALYQTYAAGLSLWAHRVCKQRTPNCKEASEYAANLLATKQALQELVNKALNGRKKRSHKRGKRFLDGVGNGSSQVVATPLATEQINPSWSHPPVDLGSPQTLSRHSTAEVGVFEDEDDDLPRYPARTKGDSK